MHHPFGSDHEERRDCSDTFERKLTLVNICESRLKRTVSCVEAAPVFPLSVGRRSIHVEIIAAVLVGLDVQLFLDGFLIKEQPDT